MTREEFLHGFDLQINYYGAAKEVSEETPLNVFDGWDSLTRTQVYYWIIDKFQVRLIPEQLTACRTVGDLMKLITL
jgi:acyl carrier protein